MLSEVDFSSETVINWNPNDQYLKLIIETTRIRTDKNYESQYLPDVLIVNVHVVKTMTVINVVNV